MDGRLVNIKDKIFNEFLDMILAFFVEFWVNCERSFKKNPSIVTYIDLEFSINFSLLPSVWFHCLCLMARKSSRLI